MSAVAGSLGKPKLRGVLHQAAFLVALPLAVALVLAADGPRARLGAGVFSVAVAACFGASALYHRGNWKPTVRPWLRRMDHAGVFLLIAGSYTPVCLLTLSGVLPIVVLAIVWTGAIAAIVLKFVWIEAPKWVAAGIGIGLGWVAVVALPQLVDRLSPVAVVLLMVGGVAYTAGAIIYARHRPDPIPSVFGYHELFHALTIVAVACQYTAIAVYVIRVA